MNNGIILVLFLLLQGIGGKGGMGGKSGLGGGTSGGLPTTGLQAYWTADSASSSPIANLADSSGHGYNLSTGAGTVTWAASQINGHAAMTFATSSLTVASGGVPYGGTISVYVVWKPTTNSGNTAITGNSATAPAFEYSVSSVPGKQGANAQAVALLGNSTTTLASGVWKISAVTYTNSGALAFYLDCAADGTASTASSIDQPINQIGAGSIGGGENFAGQVAWLGIYNVGYNASVCSYLQSQYPSA